MKPKLVPLGELIYPAPLKRAGRDEYPILSMTMHGGLVDQAAKFGKRIASADTSPYKVVQNGQLVVGFPIDEGVLAFQRKYSKAIVSPAYDIWDLADETLADREYLERFLRSIDARKFYSAKLRGSTARRRTLPDDIFLSLEVPMPSLGEQRRIVAILVQAESLQAKRRQALAKLNTLTQLLFIEMFGDPSQPSSKWQAATLGESVQMLQYGPRFHNESYVESGVRIARITDLDSSGELDYSQMPKLDISEADKRNFILQPGDIIFARTGATVGKVSCIRESAPECIAGAYFIRLRFDSERITPDFAYAALGSKSLQEIIATQSRQAAQQNFSGPGLRRLPLPIAPLPLQKEFSRRVRKIEQKREAVKISAEKLDRMCESLQHRAFRGEL